MPVNRRPWDLQPKETKRSYEIFREFLALGPQRSLSKLAQRMGLNTTTQYKRWSARYDWQARAREYDVVHHIELDDLHDKRSEVVAILLGASPSIARSLVEIATNRDNSVTARLKANAQIMDLLGMKAPKRVEVSGPERKPLRIEHTQAIIEKLPHEALVTLRNVLTEATAKADEAPTNGEGG
jgi:hypothetical protein